MTPQQIALVQCSMRTLVPHAAFFARNFYGALFALDPALRPIFRGDMAEQGKRLVRMLQLAVEGLDKLDELTAALHALGRRHAGYGVRHYDFETVGVALMRARAGQRADAPDETTLAAWRAAYGLMAREIHLGMIDAGIRNKGRRSVVGSLS